MKHRITHITAFILSLAILFSTASSINTYAAENRLNIDIGDSFSSTEVQTKLPVKVKNLPQSGLSSASFVIEFEDGLILSEVKPGEIINSSSDLSYFVKFNKIYILYSDSSGGIYPIKNEGNLCYLTFKVSALVSKDSFIVKRITSDSEIFADNYLNKLQADFSEGRILKKDKLYRVQSNKTWKVNFNQEINPNSLTSTSVLLMDISGQTMKCEYKLSSDRKSLEILPPEQGYNLNSNYTLVLKNNISSKYGRYLTKEQNIDFYIDR
jgi:hypothetical protein